MTFDAILAQVLDLLQREGRVSYRALKLRFDIQDDYIEGLKDELIYAKKLAVDEDNRVLVWTGNAEVASLPPAVSTSALASAPAPDPEHDPLAYTPPYLAEKILTSRRALEGERKLVTVLFADLKGSTELIRDLDPEQAQALLDPALRHMMDAVHRFEGTVNQGFCRKVRFLGKIQKSGVRNSMTYRLPNSRKSNFATEPLGPPQEPGGTGRQHTTGGREVKTGITSVISELMDGWAIPLCPSSAQTFSGAGHSFPRQQTGRPQAALDTLYRDWLCFLSCEENREDTPDAAQGHPLPRRSARAATALEAFLLLACPIIRSVCRSALSSPRDIPQSRLLALRDRAPWPMIYPVPRAQS
jgi:hypothetical protein